MAERQEAMSVYFIILSCCFVVVDFFIINFLVQFAYICAANAQKNYEYLRL